jgi:hypothetical protein
MRVRINNIECRFNQGRYEIVKWQSNVYFGKEEEYISNGWVLCDGYYTLNNTSIQSTIFKQLETCYTIATLHYDKGEGCCDMKTIGARLLDLDKNDRADFFSVYEYAEHRIVESEVSK